MTEDDYGDWIKGSDRGNTADAERIQQLANEA